MPDARHNATGYPSAVAKTARVQDDLREQQLAAELRLERSPSRIGWDARDENDNRFELKTTTTTSVSTGRDVGLAFLQRLRTNYVIVARGPNTEYGFNIEEVWFMPPGSLAGWTAPKEEKQRRDATIGEAALDALKAAGGTDNDLKRLAELVARGMTLNNPHISMKYVREHGIRLDAPAALRLRELVRDHPVVPPEPLPPLAEVQPPPGGELEDA